MAAEKMLNLNILTI